MSRTAAIRKQKEPLAPPAVAALAEKKPILVVEVDWANMPVLLAQNYYAKLKAHFEKAGAILNARTTGSNAEWICYMSDKSKDCPTKGQLHNTLPKSIDNSHIDPKTGLIQVVRLCSEICHIRYQQILIDERREKYAPKRGE